MKPRSPTNRWIHVRSSAVRSVRYRDRQRKLDVRFTHSPRCYEYDGVPRSKFRRLMTAESKGEFVNKEIKPNHPYRVIAA